LKKLIIFILSIILAAPVLVYALDIGGALTQGKGKFSIGLDGEYIFNRKTENEAASFVGGGFTGAWEQNIKIHNLYRNTIKLSYGILDYLDIYVKLGEAAFTDSKLNIISGSLMGLPGTLYGSAKLKGKDAFAWGGGLKAAYPVLKTWYIGCDMQYLEHTNFYKTERGYIEGLGRIDLNWRGKMSFMEWHVAPYLAKKIGPFVPYVGGKYSYLRIQDQVRGQALAGGGVTALLNPRRYTAEDNFGAFCGLDFNLGDKLSFNVEGRFIDETAMSMGAAYKF